MAFAFKKFRNLEQQPPEEAPDKSADTKPAKKSKLSMYSHILSSFENSETAEDKRKKTIERIKQREREKKAREQEKLELEKQKREEELELQRQKKEEEDKKRREEEEERIREEIARKKEAEEKERRRKEWERTEGKYAGLKPAAAMFQRALDAKGSKNDTAAEKRVAALKKGTISEIRSKIFEQKADTRKTENKTKPGPKKLIITPANKEETIQSIIPEDKPVKTVSKEETVVTHSETEYNDKQLEGKEKTNISQDEENNCDKKVEENANKRQSFISDFAALEKTYKILGLSKISQDINEEETGKVPVKKRHNSEGKIKNKDKAKANKKPEIESDKPKEAKVDLVLKVQNQASRNYFQEKINETKGLNKDGQQLLGPRLRKKGSVANVFEQNSTDKAKRESQTIEEIRVDSEKFNSFLNKFESKDGREEARLKMIKITKEQKEFDRQRKAREKKYLEEQEELKKKAEEDQDKILQAALEEEILKQQKIEEELNMERIRNIEEEFIKLEKEEDEAAAKKKVVKKKKKNKKVNEDPVEAPPKINLLAGDVTNVRSVFEKNKKQVDHIKEPLKPVRINKLTVNPFEHLNTSEPTVERN